MCGECNWPKWININDGFPENDKDVLIYNGSSYTVSCVLSSYYNEYGNRVWSHRDEEFAYHSITHWMPLPALPKD